MSIRRYLEQLVEDIRESGKNKERNIVFPSELIPNVDLPEKLEHIPVVPAQKVYQWMKIDPEAFPPTEQLNEDQIIYLCNILKQLFEHYNYEVQMPHKLPFNMVYQFLIKALYKTETCGQENLKVISFCEGDQDKCPFGEYCTRVNEDYCSSWLFGHWWEGYDFVRKNI